MKLIAVVNLLSILLCGSTHSYFSPSTVNPVLLVPGTGGTLLQLAGSEQDVWIGLEHFLASLPSVLLQQYKLPVGPFADNADNDFRQFLLGKYHGDGEIGPVFSTQEITVPYALMPGFGPSCRHNKKVGGLCGIEYVIDIVDRGKDSALSDAFEDLTAVDSFNNYAALTHYLENNLGLVPGETLFGFPYDWRQSVRRHAVLLRLDQTLRTITKDGAKPASIISHSMGCMVIKSYIQLYPDNAKKFIAKWIAIGGPFQGVGGEVLASFFGGYLLGNKSICNCSARQLAVQSPAIMELLPGLNSVLPPLRLTIETPSTQKVVSGTSEILNVVESAYATHTFAFEGAVADWPLSQAARGWAAKTQELLHDTKMPDSIEIFAVSGTGIATPYSGILTMEEGYQAEDLICESQGCAQNSCVASTRSCELKFETLNGDGTVPAESALNPYGVGDSRNLVRHLAYKIGHQDLVKPSSGLYDLFAIWLGYSPARNR